MFDAKQPASTLYKDLLRNDDRRSEVHRLLWLVRDDDSATAQCLAAAKRIERDGSASWRPEWQGLAERCVERTKSAAQSGAVVDAAQTWTQAAIYYLAAASGSDAASGRPLIAAANRCVVGYLDSINPPGAAVTIPWVEGRALDGLLCPVDVPGPAGMPMLICVAETRYRKEALAAMLAPQARARGIATLCIDAGEAADDDQASDPDLRMRPETAIVAAIDHVVETLSVSPRRIAVMADGSASSLVARAVALDGRVAASVCDAGLWELWERAQADGRTGYSGIGEGAGPALLHCPTLVPLDAADGIEPAYARRLLAGRHHRTGQVRVEQYGSTDAAGWAPDPILAADTLLDWLCAQIDPDARADDARAHRLA